MDLHSRRWLRLLPHLIKEVSMQTAVAWRKSSYCAAGECVEVAEQSDGSILIRSSIKERILNVKQLTRSEFAALAASIKSGEFEFD